MANYMYEKHTGFIFKMSELISCWPSINDSKVVSVFILSDRNLKRTVTDKE